MKLHIFVFAKYYRHDMMNMFRSSKIRRKKPKTRTIVIVSSNQNKMSNKCMSKMHRNLPNLLSTKTRDTRAFSGHFKWENPSEASDPRYDTGDIDTYRGIGPSKKIPSKCEDKLQRRNRSARLSRSFIDTVEVVPSVRSKLVQTGDNRKGHLSNKRGVNYKPTLQAPMPFRAFSSEQSNDDSVPTSFVYAFRSSGGTIPTSLDSLDSLDSFEEKITDTVEFDSVITVDRECDEFYDSVQVALKKGQSSCSAGIDNAEEELEFLVTDTAGMMCKKVKEDLSCLAGLTFCSMPSSHVNIAKKKRFLKKRHHCEEYDSHESHDEHYYYLAKKNDLSRKLPRRRASRNVKEDYWCDNSLVVPSKKRGRKRFFRTRT